MRASHTHTRACIIINRVNNSTYVTDSSTPAMPASQTPRTHITSKITGHTVRYVRRPDTLRAAWPLANGCQSEWHHSCALLTCADPTDELAHARSRRINTIIYSTQVQQNVGSRRWKPKFNVFYIYLRWRMRAYTFDPQSGFRRVYHAAYRKPIFGTPFAHP